MFDCHYYSHSMTAVHESETVQSLSPSDNDNDMSNHKNDHKSHSTNDALSFNASAASRPPSMEPSLAVSVDEPETNAGTQVEPEPEPAATTTTNDTLAESCCNNTTTTATATSAALSSPSLTLSSPSLSLSSPRYDADPHTCILRRGDLVRISEEYVRMFVELSVVSGAPD